MRLSMLVAMEFHLGYLPYLGMIATRRGSMMRVSMLKKFVGFQMGPLGIVKCLLSLILPPSWP